MLLRTRKNHKETQTPIQRRLRSKTEILHRINLKMKQQKITQFSLYLYTKIHNFKPKLRLRQYIPLSYFILLFFSGILKKPINALIIAALYEVGFIGLCLIYTSRLHKQQKTTYLAAGSLMILFCIFWLEIALYIIH